MLRKGSTILSIWSGINFLLAALILTSVVVFKANSPLLVMVFEKSEIAGLDAKVIASLNALTILYNSCSMVLSILVWLLIRKNLIAGRKWAFWAVLFAIGFLEVMAFIASAPIGNARWQVNVVLSVLYVAGIGLSGYSLFIGDKRTNALKHTE
ncbi:MAG TPA: hypothetical protein VMV68_08355 [Spirochaetia bacterium]|nr:hypothetical protein [Spirochaetia bacterium]